MKIHKFIPRVSCDEIRNSFVKNAYVTHHYRMKHLPKCVSSKSSPKVVCTLKADYLRIVCFT